MEIDMEINKNSTSTWNLILSQRKYYMIHFARIVESNYNYINLPIRFYSEGINNHGILILSSTEQDVIMDELKRAAIETEQNPEPILTNNLNEYRWFLILCRLHDHNVTYAIVSRDEVDWSLCKGDELVLKNGIRSINIFASSDQKEVFKKMASVKINNYHGIFEITERDTSNDSPNFLLIQYSHGKTDVSYEIVPEKDCEYSTHYVTYAKKGRNVHQGIILNRTPFNDILECQLEQLEEKLFQVESDLINYESYYVKLFHRFDTIDFRMMAVLNKKEYLDYYYHSDGRMYNLLAERELESEMWMEKHLCLEEMADKELATIDNDFLKNTVECRLLKWLAASNEMTVFE